MDYLGRDYLINASIIEPVKNGTAEVMFASPSAIMVKDKLSDVVMLQTQDLDLADKLLDDLPEGCDHIVAHNARLAEFTMKKLGYTVSVPCYQAVYNKKDRFTLPDFADFTVRPMTEAEAEKASTMYGFTPESAAQHIRLGLVYGGYTKAGIAAMIGLHLQGSMGLLVVAEEFRRRGYGEIMEKFLINRLLDKNLVPYCQIVEGNTASLSLQAKLGLDISKNMLYWLH